MTRQTGPGAIFLAACIAAAVMFGAIFWQTAHRHDRWTAYPFKDDGNCWVVKQASGPIEGVFCQTPEPSSYAKSAP